MVVDLGAAENVMPRIVFPEIGIRPTERSKNGKGLQKGPGGEHIKNCGQQVMSVRIPDGFVRKSTWQVADVRRPQWCQPLTSSRASERALFSATSDEALHHEQEEQGGETDDE